jgi:phosphatidylglycerophosphate synthase
VAGVPVAAHAPAGRAVAAAELLRRDGPAEPPAGLHVAAAESLSYWHALRKREAPYALLLTPESLCECEWRMFMGTYKGATDFVTKWLWPRPAFHVTRLCARLRVTPNMVTFLGLIAVILAFFAFLYGQWLPGLAAAWAMTFLDTVDGKLARITLSSSRFGNLFDHSIDLVHPPFWYVAWGLGLDGALSDTVLAWTLAAIIAGYVLQRLIEGLSILLFQIEIHVWRPIDTLFRQVTARRNPNLALLTVAVLIGRPDLGLVAVALWTALCLLLHGVQLGQAWLAWRRDGRLESWMAKPL